MTTANIQAAMVAAAAAMATAAAQAASTARSPRPSPNQAPPANLIVGGVSLTGGKHGLVVLENFRAGPQAGPSRMTGGSPPRYQPNSQVGGSHHGSRCQDDGGQSLQPPQPPLYPWKEEKKEFISLPPVVPGARRKVKRLNRQPAEPAENSAVQQGKNLAFGDSHLSTSTSTLEGNVSVKASGTDKYRFSRSRLLQKNDNDVRCINWQTKLKMLGFREDYSIFSDDEEEHFSGYSSHWHFGHLNKNKNKDEGEEKKRNKKLKQIRADIHHELEKQLLIVCSLINSWANSLYETTGYDGDEEEEEEEVEEKPAYNYYNLDLYPLAKVKTADADAASPPTAAGAAAESKEKLLRLKVAQLEAKASILKWRIASEADNAEVKDRPIVSDDSDA